MNVAALILATVLAAGTPAPGSDGARSPASCDALPVVAHRGVHSRWTTEDTSASFARAVQKGADVVEGDARLSADGTWVLMHDDTVDRTTHGHGRVSRMSDQHLASVRYDDGRLGVSTVDQALTPITASPTSQLQIEIKPANPSRAALHRFVALINAHGLRERTTITSFHPGVLTRLRHLDPGGRTALILSHRPTRPGALRRYGSQVELQSGAVTRHTVHALHRAGIQVLSWTVDSRHTWRHVVRSGADGVITDRVSSSQRWCRVAG